MPRQQQLLGHVEDQQRLHPVVGEPFLGLGERQISQRLGMAQEGAVVVADCCGGHRNLQARRDLKRGNPSVGRPPPESRSRSGRRWPKPRFAPPSGARCGAPPPPPRDRESVVKGKSVSVREGTGGGGHLKKKKK